MAPVAAARRGLLEAFCSNLASGSIPSNFATSCRVASSSAHMNIAEAQCIWSSSLLLIFGFLVKFSLSTVKFRLRVDSY